MASKFRKAPIVDNKALNCANLGQAGTLDFGPYCRKVTRNNLDKRVGAPVYSQTRLQKLRQVFALFSPVYRRTQMSSKSSQLTDSALLSPPSRPTGSSHLVVLFVRAAHLPDTAVENLSLRSATTGLSGARNQMTIAAFQPRRHR